jgi:hypothetical protein
MRGDETDSVRLRELDGRDRPLPIMASDRDSQPMHFVQPNALDSSGLSVGEDHRLVDQLDLGLLELADRTPGRSLKFRRGAAACRARRPVAVTASAVLRDGTGDRPA